jgi:predicted RecB family nuclease
VSAPATNRVNAQDFYDFDKCPHRVYLNRFGAPTEKLPQSDFLNLLFEEALLHEGDVVKDLPYETPEGATLEEQALSTLQLMQNGAERIYHAVFLEADKSGIPDLVEKVPGKSKFGEYFYRPVDIKNGSGYDDEEKGFLRPDYGLQMYHYGLLLQAAQGTFPPEAEILNRRKQRVPYRLDQFKILYDLTLPKVHSLVTGADRDEPSHCAYCDKCQWWGHCEKILVAAEDVTLLPGVGRSRKVVLKGVGIRSIPDLSKFDFSKVKLKGVGQKTIDSMTRAAISVLSNKMQVLGRAGLPDPPRKVYFDFEDDPTQQLIYLCGMWIEPALEGLNYHGLFCTDQAGEQKIWADLQGLCAALAAEDYRVFHYSSYEEKKMNTLERKYGLVEKDAIGIFRSRMVDLLPAVKRTVVLPTRNYSLKSVAPFIGLKYSAQDAGGAQSIVWFQEYQKHPEKNYVLETLLTYNKEDCLAMKGVEAWLRNL